MRIMIYIAIIVLYAVLLFWTWSSTKDFDSSAQKIGFIIIGLIVLMVVTLILFNISKSGVQYPNQDMVSEVRKVALLVFIPINGFLSLPHIARLAVNIRDGSNDTKNKRRMMILLIVIIVAVIVEVSYFKSFQKGIIEILNNR